MKGHIEEKTGLGAEHFVRITINLLVHLSPSAGSGKLKVTRLTSGRL
jgi:uncharacterized protein (UPF0371 family)